MKLYSKLLRFQKVNPPQPSVKLAKGGMTVSALRRTFGSPPKYLLAGVSSQSGVILIEVLFALFILLIGLLGLAAVQLRIGQANIEAYQRAQGLNVLTDMVDRLTTHRQIARCLSFSTDVASGAPYLGNPAPGGGVDGNLLDPAAVVCDNSTGGVDDALINGAANVELAQWDAVLRGASEDRAGAAVGAMTGARGCVSFNDEVATGMRVYTIAVSWQGVNDTFSPPVDADIPAKNCGAGLYGEETKRRTVWTTVRVANLR